METGSIAEILGAIAALVAAIVAVIVQFKVSRTQRVLDERQDKLDENQRIVNDGGLGIPVGDAGAWKEYNSRRGGGSGRAESSKAALNIAKDAGT